jgi:hypothetical protein
MTRPGDGTLRMGELSSVRRAGKSGARPDTTTLEEPLRPLQGFERMRSEVAQTGGGQQPLPNQLRRGRGQTDLPTVGSSREPRELRAHS